MKRIAATVTTDCSVLQQSAMIGGIEKDSAAIGEVSGSARARTDQGDELEQIVLKDKPKPKMTLFRQATQFVRPRQHSTATRVIRAGRRTTCMAVLAIWALLVFCGAGALAVILSLIHI